MALTIVVHDVEERQWRKFPAEPRIERTAAAGGGHGASRGRRAVSRDLWARLLARIYEALPLSGPICHSQMRIIAFINDAGTVNKILDHIGESTRPPRIAW